MSNGVDKNGGVAVPVTRVRWARYPRHRVVVGRVGIFVGVLIGCLAVGCTTQSPRAISSAVHDVQNGDYAIARRKLRRFAHDETSPDVILDNLRLAVAALHDGAFFEAEDALRRTYPYLVSGTVNTKDHNAAADFEFEGRKVWKGEPFEQAMAWYYQSLAQMIKGDWENARAASRNMLFTLVDFVDTQTVDEAMRRAESPEWFDENAAEVESDLVLGYLMAGISERWQSRPGDAEEMFIHARKLRPDLGPLITQLHEGDYNTLVFVEAQPGPRREPRGRYGEYFVYRPKPTASAETLIITDETGSLINSVSRRTDVVDTWTLAQHPRWWSRKSLRETKRILGEVLQVAGAGAVVYGSNTDDANTKDKAFWAGIAAMIVGEAMAQSSAADRRHFDVLPRVVYLIPLQLDARPNTIRFTLPTLGLDAVRHDLRPGAGTPAVYVVRLERGGRWDGEPDEPFDLVHRPIAHPNDVTGPVVGTSPYILGGTCVCTPTQEVLDVYHAGGFLRDDTLEDLRERYRAQGIVFVPQNRGEKRGETWRHVLDGGRWLYTPVPGSAGFERLTYETAPPYTPRQAPVKSN